MPLDNTKPLLRFRKLRIAWSVFWGVACVLLVALWVRSYSWADFSRCPLGTQKTLGLGSSGGRLFLRTYPNNNARTFTTDSERTVISLPTGWGRKTSAQRPAANVKLPLFSYSSSQPYDADLMFPHWLLVIVCIGIAASPWMLWRFSLRTLLIATTLVAVGLGAIVYFSS
jgi:hypothetical protein